MNDHLPERMLIYRAKHDMSQKEMAEKAKVTLQTINNIERGVQNPSRLTRAKIEFLIGEEET